MNDWKDKTNLETVDFKVMIPAEWCQRQFETFWKDIEGNWSGSEKVRMKQIISIAFTEGFTEGKMFSYAQELAFNQNFPSSQLTELVQ